MPQSYQNVIVSGYNLDQVEKDHRKKVQDLINDSWNLHGTMQVTAVVVPSDIVSTGRSFSIQYIVSQSLTLAEGVS